MAFANSQACLKEAMRMHPGVSYPLERVVPPGGANLCNTDIPAGTIIGVNAAVIHRDIGIFGPDADQFRPERWLDKEDEEIKIMDRHLLTVSTCQSSDAFLNITQLVARLLLSVWPRIFAAQKHFFVTQDTTNHRIRL